MNFQLTHASFMVMIYSYPLNPCCSPPNPRSYLHSGSLHFGQPFMACIAPVLVSFPHLLHSLLPYIPNMLLHSLYLSPVLNIGYTLECPGELKNPDAWCTSRDSNRIGMGPTLKLLSRWFWHEARLRNNAFHLSPSRTLGLFGSLFLCF